jgi:hypothetical protein
MIESFEIIYRLIVDNTNVDKEMDELIEKNFWTLCDYTFYLFGRTQNNPFKKKTKNPFNNLSIRGKEN